jgi:multidrug efflux pump
MLFSTLIAIFFVPLFFWGLESISGRFGGKKAHGGAIPVSAHDKRKGD